MKSCEEYQEMISAYVDDELSKRDVSRMFTHLGECAECKDFMRSLLKLRSAIRETATLHEESAVAPAKFWRRKFSISYAVAAVLAFVLLVSGGLLFERSSHQPRVTEYVYLTPYPAVYAIDNTSQHTRPQN